ncbi:MAG: hypothetical protein R2764_23430 [Bacteroidales bacterium]
MDKTKIIFVFLIVIYVIVLKYNGYVQSIESVHDNPDNIKKNINEIVYQFPLMLGYSYYHNFNNRIVPGFGLKLGFGYVINGYYGFGWSEMLSVELKFKQLFSKKKTI